MKTATKVVDPKISSLFTFKRDKQLAVAAPTPRSITELCNFISHFSIHLE
ncbi:hypothetical protein [Prochlorococcus marinus]|nr:hypothetical protein [Prochlorococcus marinus]